MIVATLYSPPMPQGASFAMMDQSREGRELWKLTQMSTHDVVAHYFEHEKVRMHFARVAGENLVSPDEKATASAPSCSSASSSLRHRRSIGGSGKLTMRSSPASRTRAAKCSPAVDVESVIVKQGRAAGAARKTGASSWRKMP